MKIYGCVNLYGQYNLLQKTLPALRRIVDYLIIVEGPYAEFPAYEREEPNAIYFIQSLADIIISKPEWKNEVEKRNTYLRRIPIGDYALIVDADEEVKGNFPELTEDVYRISLYEKGKLKNNLLRLVKKTKDLEYRNCHNYLWREKELLNKQEWPVLENFILEHHLEQSWRRRKAKEKYYEKLRQEERMYRETNGI